MHLQVCLFSRLLCYLLLLRRMFNWCLGFLCTFTFLSISTFRFPWMSSSFFKTLLPNCPSWLSATSPFAPLSEWPSLLLWVTSYTESLEFATLLLSSLCLFFLFLLFFNCPLFVLCFASAESSSQASSQSSSPNWTGLMDFPGAWYLERKEWHNTCKGDVTRDDSQWRFFVQHNVAMLEQCCNHLKQCCNAVLC